MLIYLSHPIDNSNDEIRERVNTTIELIQDVFKTSNHHFFKPGTAFSLGGLAKPDHTIEEINQKAQSLAGAVIVIWPKGAKSWGVPVETERALKNNQPIIFLTDNDSTWAMPTAWASDGRIKKVGMTKEDIEEAKAWL